DTEPPKIEFVRPTTDKVPVGYPTLLVQARVSDPHLESYRFYVGDSTSVLFEETGVANTSGAVHQNLDSSGWQVGDEITLVVEAEDKAGNSSRQVKIVHVEEDLLPRLRATHPVPDPTVTRGGLAYQTLRLEDDFYPVSVHRV